MDSLPKVARDRLRANSPAEHPDADLLTAFTERLLSERERSELADHLARCAECRQVVAIAVPELEAAMVDAAAPHARGDTAFSATVRPPSSITQRFWLRSPVLRWGALAACLVVVGAAVLNYRRSPTLHTYAPLASREMKPETVAGQEKTNAPESREFSADADKAAPKQNVQPGLLAKLPEKNQKSKAAGTAGKFEGRDRFDEMAVGKTAATREEALALEGDKGAPVSQSAKAANQVPAAVPQVPATPPPARAQDAKKDAIIGAAGAKETVEVSGEAREVESQTAMLKRKPQESGEDGRMKATVAKPSTSFSAAIADAAANEGFVGARAAKWSLSSGGLPQRSFDSGVTWQEIPVEKASGFRALCAEGQEVWVGGSAGLLYHSSDNGLHWVRVIPSAGGIQLKAEITNIEFLDPLHGHLSAADGATWTTSDGGKTWQKN